MSTAFRYRSVWSIAFVLCLVCGVEGGARQASPQASSATAPLSPAEAARRKELLHSRVTEIYKLFQIPAWRKAEAYLTEDSKDIYYEMPKGAILDFSVKNIAVQPDGVAAVASVEIKFNVARFPTPFPLLQKTRWVWEGDNWFLKLERVPNHPLAPFMLNQPPAAYKNAILRFEKMEQEISRGNHEYVFSFQNAGKEPLSLQTFVDDCACMEARLDKQTYAPGEAGRLRVNMRIEADARPRDYTVRVYGTPGGHWVLVKLALK